MHATEFAALLVFCTAMSFTPGPNTMTATAMASNHGWRHALRFCLGVPAGWTLLMLASGLGLGALVLELPALRLAVKALGIGYMVWLAWRLAGAGQLVQVDAARLQIGFWGGVGLQFVNIKAWMLALTLSAGWVVQSAGAPAPNPGQRLLIICLVMMAFAFVSNLLYALLGALARRLLAQGRRLLWFNRSMALVLLAIAVWMTAA